VITIEDYKPFFVYKPVLVRLGIHLISVLRTLHGELHLRELLKGMKKRGWLKD